MSGIGWALLLLIGGGFALDTLTTGLESAWSVGRRLLTSYTGPIIRVRRSSDSTEQDFSAVNGVVSVSAVQTFCGAGDGFLTTIYGQSVHARNLVQTIAAQQPQVVASGVAVTENGRLAAAWDGSVTPRHLVVPASTTLYKFLHNGTSSTGYSVQRVNNDAVEAKILFGNQITSPNIGIRVSFSSSEALIMAVRGVSTELPVDVTKTGTFAFNVASYFIDADNATAADREDAWMDGTILATDNVLMGVASTANATRDFYLGATHTNVLNFNGNICELVLWSQDNRAQRTIWEASAKTFWGTP